MMKDDNEDDIKMINKDMFNGQSDVPYEAKILYIWFMLTNSNNKGH